MLLQCGSERLSRATVALLGRFLPRLGPLPQGERPFFFLPRAGFLEGASRRVPLLKLIRPPPGKGAIPQAGFRPGDRPIARTRSPAAQTSPTARSAARPCRARGGFRAG